MHIPNKLLIILILLGAVVLGFYYFTGKLTEITGFVGKEIDSVMDTKDAKFDSCLGKSNITLYVREDCPNCIKQQDLIGIDYNFIEKVNCDGNNLCKNFLVLPAWSFNKEISYRLLSLEELKNKTGC